MFICNIQLNLSIKFINYFMFNKKYIQISKFIILSKKFIYLNNEKDDVNPIIIIYNVCN